MAIQIINSAVTVLVVLGWVATALQERMRVVSFKETVLVGAWTFLSTLITVVGTIAVPQGWSRWMVAIALTGFTGYLLWLAWTKRPPRKRKPARVLGKVSESLHRRGLVVVPQ